MTEVTMSTLDQGMLDDMRHVAEWATVRTAREFSALSDGVDRETFTAMCELADLVETLMESGYPQDRNAWPDGDERTLCATDLTTLRWAVCSEMTARRCDMIGKTPRAEATYEWALARLTLAERVLAYLDALDADVMRADWLDAPQLAGDDLRAARAVVESAILRYAQIIPDSADEFDDIQSLRALSFVAAKVGRVGDPERAADDTRGVLLVGDVATLIAEARAEEIFGAGDILDNDDLVGAEEARRIERSRAANARRVLRALGVSEYDAERADA